MVNQCKLTDLSLGGCYVQTESPFPQSSAVDLCLRAPAMEIHAEGLVRVMHPGQGMGIEFPATHRRTAQECPAISSSFSPANQEPRRNWKSLRARSSPMPLT